MKGKDSKPNAVRRRAPRSSIPVGAIELSLEDFVEPPVASHPPLAPALQRRLFTRAPYVTLARLLHDTRAVIARIEDVSEGGMRVRSPHEVPIGSTVELHFALPITGEPLGIRAVVRWVSTAGAHHLLGVAFERLDDPARLTFIRYVTVMAAFGP